MTNPIRNERTQELVAKATRVNRQIRLLTLELETLKISIRKEAERVASRRGSEELLEFDSPEGVATVCFVSSTPSLLPSVDVWTELSSLDGEDWHALFDIEVVLAKGFTDRLPRRSKETQALVGKLLKWSDPAPRVTLPK